MATSAVVPSVPTVTCAVSLDANAMSADAEKPSPGADATTSVMDVPSLNAAFTCSRAVAPTAPVSVTVGVGVESDVTAAAELLTTAPTAPDTEDA